MAGFLFLVDASLIAKSTWSGPLPGTSAELVSSLFWTSLAGPKAASLHQNFRGAVTVKSAVFLEGSGVVRDLLDDVRVLQFLVNESTTTKSSNANTIAWLSSAHPGAVIDETFCPQGAAEMGAMWQTSSEAEVRVAGSFHRSKKICRPSSYIKTHELLSCVHVSE